MLLANGGSCEQGLVDDRDSADTLNVRSHLSAFSDVGTIFMTVYGASGTGKPQCVCIALQSEASCFT